MISNFHCIARRTTNEGNTFRGCPNNERRPVFETARFNASRFGHSAHDNKPATTLSRPMPAKRNGPELHRSWLSFTGAMFAHTVKQRNCPFLNSFIPDAIGTVSVTPVTHIGTVNTKIMPIPTLNPGEKSFDRRIELSNQDLAREYPEA